MTPKLSAVAAVLACTLQLVTCLKFERYGFDPNVKPGKLILTMLVKNEEAHLEKSLPAWAKVIDYWVIGLDDNNTDASDQVIQKHLSHIPGEVVVVHFDGMGPTWTVLVEHGVKHYPDATHGILSDADFVPLNSFDKRQLDHRCSKHMFSVATEDHSNVRRLDWIYRNIPGAKVERRTHQTLVVPELKECPAVDPKGNPISQTLIDLVVEEHTGGYQDRTPGKQERYIGWLKADLVEYPEDGRTLYYLGMAYYDRYQATHDKIDLEYSLGFFDRRIAIPDSKESYYEERWFALLKAGEIQERFYRNFQRAIEYYDQAVEADPERADGWFYLGQSYRLSGRGMQAFEKLKQAVKLEMPERSLFQWGSLYSCVRHLELLRTMPEVVTKLGFEDLVVASRSGEQVVRHCSQQDRDHVHPFIKSVKKQLPIARKAFDKTKNAERAEKKASGPSTVDKLKAELHSSKGVMDQEAQASKKAAGGSSTGEKARVYVKTDAALKDAEAAVAAIIKGEVDYTVHLGVAFSIIVGTVAFTRKMSVLGCLLLAILIGYSAIASSYFGFKFVHRPKL